MIYFISSIKQKIASSSNRLMNVNQKKKFNKDTKLFTKSKFQMTFQSTLFSSRQLKRRRASRLDRISEHKCSHFGIVISFQLDFNSDVAPVSKLIERISKIHTGINVIHFRLKRIRKVVNSQWTDPVWTRMDQSLA